MAKAISWSCCIIKFWHTFKQKGVLAMGLFHRLKHEKDQISSKIRLRSQLEIHTLSVT